MDGRKVTEVMGSRIFAPLPSVRLPCALGAFSPPPARTSPYPTACDDHLADADVTNEAR